MLHTTYKKGIELFDKDISERQIFTVNDSKGTLKNTIIYESFKSFFKSLAIKSNEEEIELLKSKLIKIKDDSQSDNEFIYMQWRDNRSHNQTIYDQISHLETQNKLIEEDKNI